MAAVEWGVVALAVAPVLLGALAFSRHPRTKYEARSTISYTGVGLPAQHLTDSLLHGAIELAPFRLTRQPATPYQLGRPDLQPDAPQPPKPVLSLSGILLGARPAAVIDGIPGHDGSVLLQVGDTIAGLRLRRVEKDRVVITGMDTTWTLKVREIWNQ